jgi:hypothetical protein
MSQGARIMVNRRAARPRETSVAEAAPAAAAAEAAATDAAADGIAVAQSAMTTARPGWPDQGTAVFVILAKFVRGGRFKALARFGATAGLAALMLEAAVRVEVIVLRISRESRHRQGRRTQQRKGADTQP